HIGGWKVAAPTQAPSNTSHTTQSMNKETESKQSETLKLDATGLACPGPIMRVKEAALKLEPGQILEIAASDSGFLTDLPAFCRANDYECLEVAKEKGIVNGRIRRPDTEPAASGTGSALPARSNNDATLVVFSGELDKAMAAFVMANGAVAMGGEATLFFTFWGLNVLRKDPAPAVEGKTFMDKMFGWMLPRGPNKLPLSNMHMAGAGTRMMKDRMAAKDLPNLPGLMEDARKGGVRLVACTMSMEAMGIREKELIDGVELGGVAEFLGRSSQSGTNLFI
ncbi:MAG: DsrE/DsrF/DrsH-like family protein, partial [Opitutales bacterium]